MSAPVAPVAHGGALIAAMRAHPDAPRPWLDLSTGINPRPYPIGDIPPRAWARLPEREEIAALEAAAARAWRAAPPGVVAAPGAQALIQWLPHLFRADRVAILAPTYAEHAARWRAAGARVTMVQGLDAIGGADVAVVVNPNNPDGRLLAPDALAAAADALAPGGRLVVDESFIDASPPDASLAPRVAQARAIVLRSFGKFYGLAGLRLGFAIAGPDDAAAIRDALGPWAVSGPAVAAGARALADEDWRRDTIARLAADAALLDGLLSSARFESLGGTSLFRLARRADAPAVALSLARRGVLVRTFEDAPDRLRFGLPGAEAERVRLATALRGV